MTRITNDNEFRAALDALDLPRQRQVAAQFVENVLALSSDERVRLAVEAAKNPDSSKEMIDAAFRGAKQASLDSHARCGADGDWEDQAGYFVARAASACVAPQVRTSARDPAWQAALSCRMARTCVVIDEDEGSPNQESEAQYRILAGYLDS